MFVPHVIPPHGRRRAPTPLNRRATTAAAAISAALTALLGSLLGGIHGGPAAAAALIVLLAAGLGFVLARTIGREVKG